MKSIYLFIAVMLTFNGLQADMISNDKMYINMDEMVASEELFHIHEGENQWLQINAIHSDSRGFYIQEIDIVKSHDGGYEKKWRCPYCNSYWPIGTPCQNSSCPSKYK